MRLNRPRFIVRRRMAIRRWICLMSRRVSPRRWVSPTCVTTWQLCWHGPSCARECVRRAGLSDASIDAIYLTGGSSALRPFQQALQTEFVGVPVVEGDLFGGVASGLAYSRV